MHERGELIRRRQTSSRPLSVADQRIGDRRRRQQTFGGADHRDDIDVEPDGTGQGADVDAVAELAVAPRRDVELGHERGAELGAGDRAADAIEVGEPIEHARGLGPRPTLGAVESIEVARTEPALERAGGPRPPLGPRAQLAGIAEVGLELVDEPQQAEGGLGLCGWSAVLGGLAAGLGGEAGQRRLPVVAPHDAGGAPDALPQRGRRAAALEHRRHVGEQCHQLRAAQTAAVELEQLGEHARRHPLAVGGARPSVPRHAGRVELVLDEPGVRPIAGEQDGDAIEAGTGTRRVDDGPHGDPHLVIGVGGRRDVQPDRRLLVGCRWPRRCRHRTVGERLGHGEHVGVGALVAGEADDRFDRPALADRGQQLQLERPQPLGEVDDDPRGPIREIVAGADDGRRQQIALVVPVGAQRSHHLGGDPRRLAAALGASQRRHGSRPGDAQLAVEVAQGDDGGGMVLDAGVQARVGVHDLAHGDIDHRCGHRLAAGAVQGRRAEQLGQAEDRDDVDGGEPTAPPEGAPGHHPGGVRGHHDGDRPQWVATLRPAHGSGQRIERRRPEGGGGDGHGHGSMVRKGCHGGGPSKADQDGRHSGRRA